jgi:hypothetical protein
VKYIGLMLWLLLWKIVFLLTGLASGFMIFNCLGDSNHPVAKSLLWFIMSVVSFKLSNNMRMSPDKEQEVDEYLKKLKEEEDE